MADEMMMLVESVLFFSFHFISFHFFLTILWIKKSIFFIIIFFDTRNQVHVYISLTNYRPPLTAKKSYTTRGRRPPTIFFLLNERGLFGGDPYRNKFSRHDLLYYDMMKIRVTFQLSINRLLSFSLLSWLTARKMFRNQCKICVTLYFEKETKLVFTKSTYEKKNLLECCFI